MHIGALLADVTLQAGMNYQYVVRPRVTRILRKYPSGSTIRKLLTLVKRVSVRQLLNWNNKRKLRVFAELLGTCHRNNIDSVQDLALWVDDPCARPVFLAVNGMGDKSFDYLRMLCGHAVFPIDRHMRYLLQLAGVGECVRRYHEAQRLLVGACERLQLDPRNTEVALWNLVRSC